MDCGPLGGRLLVLAVTNEGPEAALRVALVVLLEKKKDENKN